MLGLLTITYIIDNSKCFYKYNNISYKIINIVNTNKEGGIIIKRLLVCLVSLALFIVLTFNVKAVFATDTNINNNNNGTNNNGTNNNGTNNNGINDNGINNNGTNNNGINDNGTTDNNTDLDDDNDLDNNNDGTNNENDVDDDNNDMTTNLLFGAGGLVIGSALTYFFARNRETI